MVNTVVAAVVLLLSSRFVKGLQVYGFFGAMVAAISIGVLTWIINWLLGLLNLA